jgi:hypothetical protein
MHFLLFMYLQMFFVIKISLKIKLLNFYELWSNTHAFDEKTQVHFSTKESLNPLVSVVESNFE